MALWCQNAHYDRMHCVGKVCQLCVKQESAAIRPEATGRREGTALWLRERGEEHEATVMPRADSHETTRGRECPRDRY